MIEPGIIKESKPIVEPGQIEQPPDVPLPPPPELANIVGLVPTVSAAPAHVPRNFADQFRIYVNGATLRFYWYDSTAGAWHYVTATA